MNDLFDLTGKVALVTGGSRGLGYQMVKAFAAHGADVFITSRKVDACEKVAAEVRAMGRKAVAYACNVANWHELEGLADAAYAAFAKVDMIACPASVRLPWLTNASCWYVVITAIATLCEGRYPNAAPLPA